jgi:glycosyltransferase involved in cell wall biosynthesis
MSNVACLNENYSMTRASENDKLEMPKSGEGGLRTQGCFKKSYDGQPLISIITVVYNGEKFLEETIESVISQSYANVEYIIIDGGSTDGTIDIIKKYEDKIDYWASEKDNGIYEAMNKGIELATGKWINFMNSGDSFYDNNILQNIFTKESLEEVDIIYGNIQVVYPGTNKTRVVKAGKLENLSRGSQFSHQSSFILSSLQKKYPYNLSNRIGADFEFYYNQYAKGKCFKYINIIVAQNSAGGVSDIERVATIVGFWNVVKKDTATNFFYIFRIQKEILKILVKKIIS